VVEPVHFAYAPLLPGHSKQKPTAEGKMTPTSLIRDESAKRVHV
jgi:hypothetical protein